MQPSVKRVLFNVLAKHLPTTMEFYRRIANFEPTYISDWYVVMSAPGIPGLEIGLIDQVSEYTPRHAWGMHEGAYLTLVVDDLFKSLELAREMGVEIIEEPVALDYGQTRALIRDPNGMVIDISTPTAELAGRDDVDFHASPKNSAIDQTQPEERDAGQTLA